MAVTYEDTNANKSQEYKSSDNETVTSSVLTDDSFEFIGLIFVWIVNFSRDTPHTAYEHSNQS